MAILGATAAILIGGVIAAPFASAAEQPATKASGLAGLLERWRHFYGIGGGGGSGATPPSGVIPSAGSGWGHGSWPGLGGSGGPSSPGGGSSSPASPGNPSNPGGSGGSSSPGGGSANPSSPGNPGGCADVEVVFARGTGEPQGLGVLGTPLVRAITAALPGRSVKSYAVVYGALASQASAGPGATDMSKHVSAIATACPNTKFVIGGYSQGATVTDIAIGITGVGTAGTAIPAQLAPRVVAVVVYGNPLGITHRTIAGSSPTYGPKAKEFCNAGDPVCGNGANGAAHLAYATNGTVTEGAQFAVGKINAS